jgi:hypothetical protein
MCLSCLFWLQIQIACLFKLIFISNFMEVVQVLVQIGPMISLPTFGCCTVLGLLTFLISATDFWVPGPSEILVYPVLSCTVASPMWVLLLLVTSLSYFVFLGLGNTLQLRFFRSTLWDFSFSVAFILLVFMKGSEIDG